MNMKKTDSKKRYSIGRKCRKARAAVYECQDVWHKMFEMGAARNGRTLAELRLLRSELARMKTENSMATRVERPVISIGNVSINTLVTKQ